MGKLVSLRLMYHDVSLKKETIKNGMIGQWRIFIQMKARGI